MGDNARRIGVEIFFGNFENLLQNVNFLTEIILQPNARAKTQKD